MQTQPAESEEQENTGPKDPLVLPRSPLNHSYCIARQAERIRHRIHPLLDVLEIALLNLQVVQNSLAVADVFV